MLLLIKIILSSVLHNLSDVLCIPKINVVLRVQYLGDAKEKAVNAIMTVVTEEDITLDKGKNDAYLLSSYDTTFKHSHIILRTRFSLFRQ